MKRISEQPSAIVTGGTDGIGKRVALGIARKGYSVVIVGSDGDKGARAEEEIRRASGNASVSYCQADLSLMREVERVSDLLASRCERLHLLVLSAGVVMGRRTLTREGLELNFALNYLGRFLLLKRLGPSLMVASQPNAVSRVVIVGAAGAVGQIHFDDVSLSDNFSTVKCLLQFQFANNLLTAEYARRHPVLASRSNLVSIACFHPGVVKTDIRRNFPGWMRLAIRAAFDPFITQTPEEAAGGVLRILFEEDLDAATGLFFVQNRKFKRLQPPNAILDPSLASKLWEFSERQTKQILEASSALG